MPNVLKKELPGTKLFIVDDLPPEDLAMLQALYSRSAESVEVHLEKVAKAGSGKFMSRFYVGYNHKSIADCGTTTMFIEGVSTLAAKAIQDWPLYSGQETSTRYIDMSKQRIVDPVGTTESKAIHDRLMDFYRRNQGRVEATIRERHPRRREDSEAQSQRLFKKSLRALSEEERGEVEIAAKAAYDGSVKARVFDSLRGFLPAGITTQLSWHTNLRQAGDHLAALAKHPAEDIRDVGLALQAMFGEQYSSSSGIGQAGVSAVTGDDNARKEREAWEQMMATHYTYTAGIALPSFADTRRVYLDDTINPEDLARYAKVLAERPRGCVIPHFLTDLGQLFFSFLLDFGSFRDIQRHRNGVCRMPLLTTEWGFEPWYIEQLDPELGKEAHTLLKELDRASIAVTRDRVDRQNYLPLGWRVPCQVAYGLPAAVYVLELRSGKTIHPTLRRVIHGMVAKFHESFPDFTLHTDMDPDDWTLRRGSQTITAKPDAVPV